MRGGRTECESAVVNPTASISLVSGGWSVEQPCMRSAIDFSAGGRKAAIVQWLIANHHSGGTMTYRDMDHIHVDVGYHFVSLGANSGRG